jgi:tetratricopeptide (TPR) repeat protein
MLRYILPTLLLLTFLVLPQATDLDSWQNVVSSDCYQAWPHQEPDYAYPSLRADLLKLDKATLNQPFWSLFGQSRNYRYLQTTTPAQRVDFAVAYWHFLNKRGTFRRDTSNLESGLEYGLDSYRGSDITYEDCRNFAISWWGKNYNLNGKKHNEVVGHLQDDDRYMQESLLDAGESLDRVHMAGVPSVLCNDSPTSYNWRKYLPFLEAGSFLHLQLLIDRGFGDANVVQELKERTILTADSVLSLAQQTAKSVKKWCTKQGQTDKPQESTSSPSYSLVNHRGQIALSVSAPSVGNFNHGVARIGLRLAAPVGSRETSEDHTGDQPWVGQIDSNHKFTPRTKYYEFRAIVDRAGAWRYNRDEYPDTQPPPDRIDSGDPATSQSEYAYNGRAESYWPVYPSDSTITPSRSENGYCGYNNRDLTAISARFDWAGKFHQGLALVLKDGKFGFINAAGEFIIPPRFEAAGSFSEGVAPALDSVSHKWGYINTSGQFVIAPRFLGAYRFSAGLAIVAISPDEPLPLASRTNQSSLAFVYGRAALDNSQAEVARQYFQKAIAADPQGPFAKQARVYLKTRVPAKTIPFDAEVELRLADSDYTGERVQLLKECIDKYPYFEWAYIVLATKYMNDNHFGDARDVLDQVRKINPNCLQALVLMSGVSEKTGDSTRAKQELKAAKELNPNDDLVRAALSDHDH